ncbi:zinc fingers and homeoboxes protein 3 [Chanos chanos]|uniref:Zinc fingers and homeoboxes protein 3 n=1 Tax=Chanos chanos TaxID=29144 RepID=A0A6J2V0A8_CHACN|nr:zinc fingers and homeoboxes protein 3-like [Chanos chanos]
MASKRKSTIPCMIPVKTMHLRDDLEQDSLSSSSTKESGSGKGVVGLGECSRHDASDSHKDGGTYTCRPCNFETQDLNLFLDHVYSGHPEFRSDPSFHCVDCGVSAAKFEGLALHNARVHPSTVTTTLQLKKRDRKVTVEQSLIMGPGESSSSKESEISITKTPIMKMLKGKSEPKRIVVSHPPTEEARLDPAPGSKQVEKKDPPAVTVTHVPTIVHNGAASKVTLPSAIQIVNGSGALPMLKTAITQVVSVVQNRSIHQQTAPIPVSSSPSSSSSSCSSSSSKNLPKVMIPLSSIPTYNASMDNSSFLKTSFSKFPYPTKAELCYLTVVTKYPEEQIKIWFTAQRLKQGISWSPEEIEDARRKMFNTIIQTAPPAGQQQQQRPTHHSTPQQTITVLPASLGHTGIPHILQGSLVGQGGVIVTQPMMANGIQVSSAPVALAVTPKPQAVAKPMMQARPAAALVADKGISMVVGTVGSSSSGNYTISNSSSGSSNSSSSSSTNSIISSHSTNSNSSVSSISSHTSVISMSGSNNGKINSSSTTNTTNNSSKISNSSTAKSSAPSNSNAKTTSDSRSSNNTIKNNSENKGTTDIKEDSDINMIDETKSSKNESSTTTSTTTATTTSTTTTTTDCTSTRKTDSSSPAPAGTSHSSRTLPSNSFLDPSFYKNKKSQEQLAALKQSFLTCQFPNQEEVNRLTSLTGLSVREVRKWFSDRRYHFRNLKGSRSSSGGQCSAATATTSTTTTSAAPIDLSDSMVSAESPKTSQKVPLSPSPHQQTTSPTTPSRRTSHPPSPTSPTTPARRPPRPPSPDFTAIRYKEREPHQVRALEASFAQDPVPSSEEVDRLRAETKMTRREIHGWFSERRKRVAAEKKKEEAERAEKEEEEEDENERDKSNIAVKEEVDVKNDTEDPVPESSSLQVKDEKQKEDISGAEPKVNPIKINLKMLKVTESNGKPEMEGSPPPQTEPLKVPPSVSQKTTPVPSPSQKGKKTADQLHLLKQVFARTQWPSSPQYDELSAKTGLPRPEVVRWFGDCRYVLKNGLLKWLESYQSMADEEDFQKGNTSVLKEHLDAHGKMDENQVTELAQSSGLTEDLVRRWFTTKAPVLSGDGKMENEEAMEIKGSPTAAPSKGVDAMALVQEDQGEVKEEQMEHLVDSNVSKDQPLKKTAEVISTNAYQGSDSGGGRRKHE